MNLVIGSGPSGVSAAYALLKKNCPVTMIDAGLEIEPDTKQRVDVMGKQSKQQWDTDFLNEIRGRTKPTTAGVPMKRVFGSDFHVRGIEKYIVAGPDNSHYCSLACGGLSNVWGAAMLPYSDDDLAHWPINAADLAPSYRDILMQLPMAALHDDLAEIFPLYKEKILDLPLSRQAMDFLDDLNKHKKNLNERNVYFGKARLAVHAEKNTERGGCVLCGLCLYGCPHQLIYNTTEMLRHLKTNPNFTYVPGVIIEKVSEENGSVTATGKWINNDETVIFKGTKLFLACGVINTAKIMLTSLGQFEKSISVKTSQHFYLPFLRWNAVKGDVTHEELNTLSQIFIELFDSDQPEANCHLQIYTYNDLYRTLFQNGFGFGFKLFEKIISKSILSRLLISQGYFSSYYSSTLTLWLDTATSKLRMRPQKNPAAKKRMTEISKKILGLTPFLKAFPVIPFLKMSSEGVGAHIGASFPMSKNPTGYETDILGRMVGFHSIHLVDASVFTDIPPSTVTLTAMANSHRIATAAGA